MFSLFIDLVICIWYANVACSNCLGLHETLHSEEDLSMFGPPAEFWPDISAHLGNTEAH